MKIHFKPEYSNLFNKIKEVEPVKNDILMTLLDGQWHFENELINIIRKQHYYVGSVTLGTMVQSLNHDLNSNYLLKKISNGRVYYKLSDNYIGLTRAAYTKYRFII